MGNDERPYRSYLVAFMKMVI